MNFEVTQLKFIRYDGTSFIRRMTPSYHKQSTVFMLHGYALRYPLNIVRLLVFPEMKVCKRKVCKTLVNCLTVQAICFWTLVNRLTFQASHLFFG